MVYQKNINDLIEHAYSFIKKHVNEYLNNRDSEREDSEINDIESREHDSLSEAYEVLKGKSIVVDGNGAEAFILYKSRNAKHPILKVDFMGVLHGRPGTLRMISYDEVFDGLVNLIAKEFRSPAGNNVSVTSYRALRKYDEFRI